MNKSRINYSVLGMSDDTSTSPSMRTIKNVYFPPDTSDCISLSGVVTDRGNGGGGGSTGVSTAGGGAAGGNGAGTSGRRGSRFFQRPRSMSVWSEISRSSMKLDERYCKIFLFYFLIFIKLNNIHINKIKKKKFHSLLHCIWYLKVKKLLY